MACQPEKAAAMVYAHPGGSILGSAELFIPEACWIAVECNCFVFNVDYRKSPEISFIDGQNDFDHALLHIYENDKKYGINNE